MAGMNPIGGSSATGIGVVVSNQAGVVGVAANKAFHTNRPGSVSTPATIAQTVPKPTAKIGWRAGSPLIRVTDIDDSNHRNLEVFASKSHN